MAYPDLLEVVVINYNTAFLLKNCLNSLYSAIKNEGLTYHTKVTVVDNDSKDQSVATIKKYFPQVNLFINKKNLGFAKANNLAIKKSKAEFIFLLNSDTLIGTNVLSGLINQMKSDSRIAVVGPKLLNPDQSLQQSAGFTPYLSKIFFWMFFLDDLPFLSKLIKPYHARHAFFYRQVQEVDWVSGAALLFRRKIADLSGLLDENIFMYGEEVEWCFRIRRANFLIYYYPQAEVIHFKGGSAESPGTAIVEEFKSVIYFYQKHFPRLLSPVRLLLKTGALLRLILFGIIGRFPVLKLYAQAIKVVG